LDAMLALAFNSWTSVPNNEYHVMYSVMSKANHSCSPNACVLAPQEGPGEMVCLRTITPGDEVTVSYLGDLELAKPVEFRQQTLKRWEFTCTCKRCAALGDDTRCFACPDPSCLGQCPALRHGVPEEASVQCDVCGQEPEEEIQIEWMESEIEIGELLLGLPGSLYSAWHPCAEFATAHPHHWLAGRWLRFLASHLSSEASETEDPEEAASLREKADESEVAAWRCLQASVGVSLDLPLSHGGVESSDQSLLF